jgi:hypothetical protein
LRHRESKYSLVYKAEGRGQKAEVRRQRAFIQRAEGSKSNYCDRLKNVKITQQIVFKSRG